MTTTADNSAPDPLGPGRPGGWLHEFFYTRPHLPYLLPLMGFMLVVLPSALGTMGGIDWAKLWFNYHPWVYAGKTLVGLGLLIWFWPYFSRIRWGHTGLGIMAGLLGLVLWIGVEYAAQAVSYHFTGKIRYPHLLGATWPELYNPLVQLSGWGLWLFYVVRIAGPTLVVPFIEELFWRDFALRAAVNPQRFETVRIGTFSWVALGLTSLGFAIGHFQWPSGILYGILMALLVIRTKRLGPAIIAHGVTNLTLGIYVIVTQDWQFW